jgi:tRNA A37 threonylcarbamoyladenosine modification protein TsaB
MFSHKTVSTNNEHFLVVIKARGKDYFFQLFDEKSDPLADAIKMTILAAKEQFTGYNLFFLGDGSLDAAASFGQKEYILNYNNNIDFLKVFENINEDISRYKNNIWPLYLADPVAEKKDPQWFAKKKK